MMSDGVRGLAYAKVFGSLSRELVFADRAATLLQQILDDAQRGIYGEASKALVKSINPILLCRD